MPHDMNNDFSRRYEILRTVADGVMNTLKIYARERYGEDFFRLAHLCFPGQSADGTIRHEELFLPWTVFCWSPPAESRKLQEGNSAILPSEPLAIDWLKRQGEAEAFVVRFVHEATRALFRFLKLVDRDVAVVTLEDMLDPGSMLKMPACEVSERLRPGDMTFCHAVTVDGVTISTHRPLDASQCTKDVAGKARFEALLSLMAGELRASGTLRDGSGRRMLENLLFMHARHCSEPKADEALRS